MGTTMWSNSKNDTDRGRDATKPSQITAKGWKDTLYRIKDKVEDNRLSLISAAMSYFAFLAFVPAVSSIVLIYAWISDPAEISQHIATVGSFIPNDFQEILRQQLTTLASTAESTLRFSAIGALLFSLYSSSKACGAIIEAMNIIHEEKEERGFIKLNLISIALTFLGVLLSVVATLVVIALPALIGNFEFGDMIETVVAAVSWIVLLTFFSSYLAIIYRFGPCRKKPKWRWVSWGAVIASVFWALGSLGFSLYAAKFGDFNKTYGSLGAMIVLLVWFYISSFVILMGAEINAELEHQTTKDTTTGPPRPMGEREAFMADTVGASSEAKTK